MRKYSRKNKSGKRGQSRRLKGGNPIANFFGFGRNTVSPQAAQAQQVATTMGNEIAGHQQESERKQEQARSLREQCDGYETTAGQLETEAAQHTRTSQEIIRTRESKNRCDGEHARRLQDIQENHDNLKFRKEITNNDKIIFTQYNINIVLFGKDYLVKQKELLNQVEFKP